MACVPLRGRIAAGLMLGLCSCGPKIVATRDTVANRAVAISNVDSTSFVLQRIVANGSPENASCNDYPNKSLAPGESYSTTFIVCGPVQKLEAETDKGTSSVEWGAQ